MDGGSNTMSCVVSVVAVVVGEGDGNGAGAAHSGCLTLGAKKRSFFM